MTVDETIYDCIVIGGGISGISFAHYLHSIDKKVLVIEKSKTIGGQIQSLPSEKNPDYWSEFGAHTCYNSYTHLLSIVKDIDGADLILPLGKGSYMTYSEGRIKKMFADMSVPSIMLNGPKIFFSSKKGKTVKEYFSNVVGRKNYDKLFSRLFRAVISQSADNYPAELFLKRRKGRYEEFPRKFTFRRGISQFLEAIVHKDNLDVRFDSEVSDIQRDDDKYKIITSSGDVFFSSRIAIATDPQTTAKLVVEFEKELANSLSTIPMFYSESVNVIVSKEKLSAPLVAGIIPIADTFHSAVSRDLVEDDSLRSFTFHFEKGKSDEKAQFEIICDVLNIKQADIIEAKKVQHILPSLNLAHLDMVEQVKETVKSEDIYILGNYFYGLSIEDCIHRSFDEFQRFKNY